ncbi:MerR family transcriptional regulator [Cellulomonas cellasea]|uniref:HTH merR-type domain-containing protein n=2 Tax=Cellulomonas cellasea TaxID=43670 RepID=A0A0A0B9F2_9CELL|nr:MerR family transcriptional regulator [Cellulomonas cellasea]KGM02833.1 hypothetical protein Q760_11110 [Cellulomonas cellasea DSM 20118]GEA86742.1 hypothetical protein CCE01nite_06910 [Cellulomonas cellasea]
MTQTASWSRSAEEALGALVPLELGDARDQLRAVAMTGLPHEAVWLRPGQVAQRAGVAVSTLHYYEQLGLIRSRRTAGDRREYRRDTLRLVALIKASQTLGISLARIKQALDGLPQDEPPTTHHWRDWRDCGATTSTSGSRSSSGSATSSRGASPAAASS